MMNQRAGRGPKLDLKLNLSPPRVVAMESPKRSTSSTTRSMEMSPTSSCLSTAEASPAEAKAMMLMGCPQCLMYVMLSSEDPKCPKCRSTFLLDILHDQHLTNKIK